MDQYLLPKSLQAVPPLSPSLPNLVTTLPAGSTHFVSPFLEEMNVTVEMTRPITQNLKFAVSGGQVREFPDLFCTFFFFFFANWF